MKKLEAKISKWKNEKGSVVVFVVCAMLFFMTVALSSYVYYANKLNNQERQIAEIKSEYEVSNLDQKQKYEDIVTGSGGTKDPYNPTDPDKPVDPDDPDNPNPSKPDPNNPDSPIIKTAIHLNGNGATKKGTSIIYSKHDTKIGRGFFMNAVATDKYKMTPTQNPIAKPERKYTISYIPNPGTVSPKNVAVDYIFNGYYASAESTDNVKLINEKGFITEDFKETQEESRTIYAHWDETSTDLLLPTRTGYSFKGWYKEAELTNKVGDANQSYIPKEDITLYAKWIDDILPSIIGEPKLNPNTWTNQDVTITVEAQDEGSGIVGYQFSKDPNLNKDSEG